MRANFVHCAVVVAILLATAGCRNSPSSSGWSWNRKSSNSSSPFGGSNGLELPSASATPPNYGATASTGAATGAMPAAYAPQGAAPYQATPYPEHPAGYANPPGAGTAMPNANPPSSNYAMPNAANPAANPQSGQYGAYGGPAGQAGAYPTTGGAYGSASTPRYAETPQAPQTGGYSAADATNPYGAAAGGNTPAAGYNAPRQDAPASAYANPSSAYGNTGGAYANQAGNYNNPGGGYQSSSADTGPAYSADSRNSGDRAGMNRYGNSQQAEAAAADAYAAQNMAAGDPPLAGLPNRGGSSYQPGNTGYVPGQNGYSPPGVPAYQSPAQANVVSTPRRDPYYRPGGTSDYVPEGGTRFSSPGIETASGASPYGAGAEARGGQASPSTWR